MNNEYILTNNTQYHFYQIQSMEENGATEFDLDWEDWANLGSFTTIWHGNKVKSKSYFL
jgi:hypothetical protein